MGRRRPDIQHQPIPFDHELQLLELLRTDRTGFEKLAMQSEGRRNRILTEVLEELGVIFPGGLQSASDGCHGQDAWMLRAPGADGVIPIEACEIKTCYHLEPGQKNGAKFEYHHESIRGLSRLIDEHQLYATFRSCPDHLERVVEVYVLYTGSALHELWKVRLEELKAGRPPKRIGYSLNQIKKFGAIKLV